MQRHNFVSLFPGAHTYDSAIEEDIYKIMISLLGLENGQTGLQVIHTDIAKIIFYFEGLPFYSYFDYEPNIYSESKLDCKLENKKGLTAFAGD